MSEADKMFKQLNYEEYKYLEHTDYYNTNNDKIISFRNDKSIAVFNAYDEIESITMQELQTINKKVEELKWKN